MRRQGCGSRHALAWEIDPSIQPHRGIHSQKTSAHGRDTCICVLPCVYSAYDDGMVWYGMVWYDMVDTRERSTSKKNDK